MRTRIAWILVFAMSGLAVGAGAALAQVDVELAFTPDRAAPGQQVTLFASLANLSSEPVRANFTVAITLGRLSTGAMPFVVPLAAGAERSAEIPFVVPMLPMGGTMTITVTATAGGATDTATASLTIVSGATTAADSTTLRAIGTSVGTALTGGAPFTVSPRPSRMNRIRGSIPAANPRFRHAVDSPSCSRSHRSQRPGRRRSRCRARTWECSGATSSDQ